MKLINVVTAHESGTVINPIGITGQLEGAIMMAGGYALCEDSRWTRVNPKPVSG